jgi:hypothetical protein
MFGYSHKQANDLIANKTGMKGSKAFPLSILVTFLPKGVLITLQKYASTSDLKGLEQGWSPLNFHHTIMDAAPHSACGLATSCW